MNNIQATGDALCCSGNIDSIFVLQELDTVTGNHQVECTRINCRIYLLHFCVRFSKHPNNMTRLPPGAESHELRESRVGRQGRSPWHLPSPGRNGQHFRALLHEVFLSRHAFAWRVLFDVKNIYFSFLVIVIFRVLSHADVGIIFFIALKNRCRIIT